MRRLGTSNFIFTLVFGLALFLCSEIFGQVSAQTPPAVSDAVEGKWYGMAGFPQDRVEIGFEFKRNEKQELKAYLYQPVMNFYGLELPGVLKKEADKYVHEDYRMSLTLKEGKLVGTYFPLHAPISLERTQKLPTEVPVPAFPRGPGPKWQTRLGGAIFVPAAVYDGVAYVGTTGGMFYAVSLKDGSFVWPFTAGRPVHGEALVNADHVYFVCDNGFLFKLDRKTGKEVWRYDLGDAQVARTLPHQVLPNSGDYDWDTHASRPVLFEDVIYVGSGDGSMHAVNAAKGERVWRSEPKGRIRTAALVDGPRVIYGSLDDTVYAVDRQTGREVWKKNTYGPLTSSPVLIDGKLIIGNRNGLLAALNPATGETVWRMLFWGSSVESDAVPAGDGTLFYIGSSDLRRISLIDAKDARVIWRTDIFGWAWPRPALSDKMVYASAIGASPYQMRHLGSLTAMDRKTGKIAWRWPTPETPGTWTNGFAAAPALDGHTLVVGGLDGTLYAFPVE